MDDERVAELAFWLAFSRLQGLGAQQFELLRELCEDRWQELPCKAQSWLLSMGFSNRETRHIAKPCEAKTELVLNWLESSEQHYLVTLGDPCFPKRLKAISTPPRILFANGNIDLLDRPQLAIVGSREPSVSGREIARQFASELSGLGWVITSGMAAGIDGCAHRAAIDANGQTTAVLGSGIDVVYPKRHHRLHDEILSAGGLILSEFAPTTPAKAQHFPRRNRIISGLSHGVLVVEAAIKSGSLISAKFALEQGREVFAVPGNIRNPLSQGCHWLIQQGAKLTVQVADILAELPYVSSRPVVDEDKNLVKKAAQNLAYDVLLDSVDYEVTSIDEVVQRSGLPTSTVMAQLLEYELRGLVASVSGGYVKLGGN